MKYPLYKKFAMTLNAYQNCVKSGNEEWKNKHYDKLYEMLEELPHGSGIDGESRFDLSKSDPNKLVFHIEYHCMDESGMYAGWYSYKIIVTPSLQNDFDLNIVGKDTPNQAKEYLYETFQYAFSGEVE
jgi:hypothetical protein